MVFKVLSSFLLLCSSPAFADDFTCVSGKTRQMNQGVEITQDEKYCYSEDFSEIVSKGCLHQQCAAFRVGKRYYASELLAVVGTPGFRLCRELGGQPEILSFKAKDKFYDTDRCVFSDGGFVSTDWLMDFYLDRSSE